MARIRRRALYIAPEAQYSVDPSANGSGYLWVPTLSLGSLVDQLELLPTDYFTGRNYPTAPIAGPDGAEVQISFPLIGLAAAAGDNVAPGAADWLHHIFEHVCGTTEALTGDGVDAGSTTSALVTDGQVTYGLQRLLPIYQGGIAVTRTQWGFVSASGGATSYTLSPALTQAPLTAAIVYGSRQYRPDVDGGPTLAAVYVDDEITYTLLGGRITSFSFSAEMGKMFTASATISFNTKTLDAGKTNLPNVGAGPAVTPLRLENSPIWLGGSLIATRSVSFDLGLATSVVGTNETSTGRAGNEVISHAPSLEIEPLRSNDHVNLKRQVTMQDLLFQIGRGLLDSGVLNTMALHFNSCHAEEVSDADENGRTRNRIRLAAKDNGQHAAGVNPNFFTFARA